MTENKNLIDVILRSKSVTGFTKAKFNLKLS